VCIFVERNLKIEIMKAITINKISAVSIKKYLKMEDVKVARCCQNGNGVLVTIANETSSIEKAIKFFSNFDLTRKTGESVIRPISTTEKYVDFGSIFNVTIN
jgi:hypothetical protein